MTDGTDCDVLVLGGGPVGMILAGLLGRRGVRTLVLEREADVFTLPRAAHIDHTGLRTLQEFGCLDEMLAGMIPNRGLMLADDMLRPLAEIPGNQRSISGLPASMYFYQPEFDRALERQLAAFPFVEMLRRHEVLSFSQDSAGVSVGYRRTDTGDEGVVRTRWLVGCDGSRSTAREMLSVDLESLDFDERWLVLDLLQRTDVSVPDYAIQVCDPLRPWVANPMPDRHYRVELRLFDDESEAEMARLGSTGYVSEHLRPLIGDVTFDVERRAIYTFHGLVASRWREGRVLLAGDAAHQMPPFLGQGMCSGIRDASNLAWKLARVVQDRMPVELLDTYELERSPHVRSIVASAVEFGRFVSMVDAEAVEARNKQLRASEMSTALSFSLPLLAQGPLVANGGGMLFPQPEGTRPLLDDVLGDDFVIIALDDDSLDDSLEWWSERFEARAVTLDAFGDGRNEVARWFQRQGIRVAVVRPDRYVMASGQELRDLRSSLVAASEEFVAMGRQ
jgi:3-(3-hydroxy-phenyl)propionate hydroxylase